MSYFLKGKHRGFAFVEFDSKEEAEAALDNLVKIDYYIFKLNNLWNFWLIFGPGFYTE